MNFPPIFAAFALFPTFSFAAGSVLRDEMAPILATNPALARSLGGALNLAATGSAMRLGNHVGNLGGSRIGPYEFQASLKIPNSAGEKVTVTLHTEVKFRDATGQIVPIDLILPASQGLTITESLLRYEVAATPIPVSFLKWEEFSLPLAEGESGNYRRGTKNGELRELEVNYDEGDHGGWTFKVILDQAKLPAQVIATSSSWKFAAPQKPQDSIMTRVLDYQDGQLVKVSESGTIDALGQPTAFQDLRVTSVAAKRVYLVAVQMANADRRGLAGLVQDAIDAQERLTEPLVTADDSRWKPFDLRGQAMQVDSRFTTTAAALYFVRQLNLLPPADSAEQPAHLWADLLSLKEGVTTVLVTATGYQDDEIEGERFLVTIRQAADGWLLTGISRQLKKWRGDDWE